MNESSGGVNCDPPRHEPAFDVRGSIYERSLKQRTLIATYGRAGACSYGPMQIMLVNAPNGAAPSDFDDLDKAFQYSVGFINSQLAIFKPLTLFTIACIWNGGSPMKEPSGGVLAYAAKLGKSYDAGIPSK
jgi:hypothetical protein